MVNKKVLKKFLAVIASYQKQATKDEDKHWVNVRLFNYKGGTYLGYTESHFLVAFLVSKTTSDIECCLNYHYLKMLTETTVENNITLSDLVSTETIVDCPTYPNLTQVIPNNTREQFKGESQSFNGEYLKKASDFLASASKELTPRNPLVILEKNYKNLKLLELIPNEKDELIPAFFLITGIHRYVQGE